VLVAVMHRFPSCAQGSFAPFADGIHSFFTGMNGLFHDSKNRSWNEKYSIKTKLKCKNTRDRTYFAALIVDDRRRLVDNPAVMM